VPVRTRWIVAAAVAATGLVWIGQGFGILRGSSFMVDDLRWAIAGGAPLLIGAVLAWTAVRGGRRV
jgi:ABC-type nickel/cobalt efflux system permease component RcnA